MSAPPPPEYCLFWIDHWSTCMQKGEWSAWIQAVFSVIAIIAAIGIAMWQRHADQKLARATERATVMVVGAATDSKLHNLIGTIEALIFEHENPSERTAIQRAQFFQTLFSKAPPPTEEQMLLLTGAMPKAAASMAHGVAVLNQVLTALDFIASAPMFGSMAEQEMLDHYLGTKPNLIIALDCLKAAREGMLNFDPGR